MKIFRKSIALCAAALVGLTASAAATANDYPNHAIRLIVPYAAGGLTDMLGRSIAQELSNELGQSVVVENRTGAGGIIGTDAIAKATPDGYTIGLLGQGLVSVNPRVHENLPYAPSKDFRFLSIPAKFSMVLVVHPDSPYKTVSDLLDAARKQPDALNYGSAGNVSTAHLTMELLKDQTGIDMMHIPYKGESQAFTELVGQRIDATFATVGGGLPLINSGRLRPLAVGDTERNFHLPEVPTLTESGVPVNVFGWYTIAAPAGIPDDVSKRLNDALVKIGASEAFKTAMQERGLEAVGSDSAVATKLVKDEEERWGAIIERAGITVD